jgi:hypothetical protein
MAEVIVPSDLYEFTFHDDLGVYLHYMGGSLLIEGETYKVQWNDKTYTCQAESGEYMGIESVVIGNTSILGVVDDTDEPFLIGNLDANLYAFTSSTDGSHTIYVERVDSVAESNSPYLLKVSKEDREFSGFKKLALERSDGTVGYFTPGEPSAKTVALDFSNGDMTVVPNKDKFLTEVSIPKPSTLIPENIAKGVTIAGVEGEYSAGGDDDAVPSKAINFYDPMGNIIYSYTRAEAAELTELPPGPPLEGFEFDCWNYTLVQVKAAKFFADVAPTYKRNGNPTAVLIVDVPAHALSVTVNAKAPSGYTGTIDWMDGSTVTTVDGAGSSVYSYAYSHVYAEPGIKCIAVYSADRYAYVNLGASIMGGSYSSVVGTAQQSSTTISPEFGLLSALGASNNKSNFNRIEGHARLKFISNNATYNRYEVCHAPSLEVISSNKAFEGSRYHYIAYAPKLRRLYVQFDSSSASETVRRDMFRYMDSVTDLWLYSSTNMPSVMNVNRRVIIDRTTVPTGVLADTQWGSGDIYVPDEAVETYKANALFAPVIDCIKPISEYPDY